MYWRIRKITPEMVARQYSVHACLIASVLFNTVLLSKVSAAKANNAVKLDCAKFARQVSNHIFDQNFLTYQDSMMALMDKENGELIGAAIQKLKGDLPQDPDHLRAYVKQLTETRSVSSLKFQSVEVGTQDAKTSLTPIDVKLKAVTHDNKGVEQKSFKLRYLVGIGTNPQTKESRLVVCGFEMLAPDADQDGGSQPQQAPSS